MIYTPPAPDRRASRVVSLIATMGSLALAAFSAPSAVGQTKAEIVAASKKAVDFIIADTKLPANGTCFSCHNTGQAIRAGIMAANSNDIITRDSNGGPGDARSKAVLEQLTKLISYVDNQQYANPGHHYDGVISHGGSKSRVGSLPNTTSSWALFSLISIDPSKVTSVYTDANFLRGARYLERAFHPTNGIAPDHVDAPVDAGNPGETARAVMVWKRALEMQPTEQHWVNIVNSGATYLRNFTPRNQSLLYLQDAAWIIMGLRAAGAATNDPKITALVSLLKASQGADGGWSLRNTSFFTAQPGDAFGTGVALSALAAVNETNSSAYPAFQKGVQWLLDNQQSDGGWALPPSGSLNTRVSGSTWAVLSLTALAASPPVISTPGNLTAEATSAAGAAVAFQVTANDDTDGNVPVTLSHASGATFAIGATTVTASASDADGNKATASFTITVADTQAPVISVPANIVREATGPAGAVVTYSATASDLVSGSIPVTGTPASGSTFPITTTLVNLKAADARGNTATALFGVQVKDTTAPVFSAVQNLTVEATGPAGATVNFNVAANDLVSGNVAVTASPASGSTFAVGSHHVSLRALDAAGNVADSHFTVVVQDTLAPIIETPANVTAEATSAAGAIVNFTASATDLVNGNITIIASHASGGTFPLGTTTVKLSATDASGNIASSSFTVTVSDTTKPVLSVPADQILEATSAAGAVANFTATATDAVGATVSYSHAPGSPFALGTTTVNVTARDAAGNEAAGSFTITVRDTTKPALTLPGNLVLEATSAAGAVGTFASSATDLVSGDVSVALSHASGTTFPLGTTTVTGSAVDAAGNIATGSFTVLVRDTIAPSLTLPANQTLEATSPAGAIASFTATATDAVGATLSSSNASGETFPIGTTVVTVTAFDAAGNTTSGTFTITVADTTAPVLTVPASQTLEATSGAGAIATFTASATDAVGATLTYSHASGSTFALGTTTVTVTAYDAAGNTTIGTFTITVSDTTAPTFSSLESSVGTLWPVNHKMVGVTLTASTSDVVSEVTTKIVRVTSNEHLNGKGDGNTDADWEITDAMKLNLRAERSGGNAGRIYTITVAATDAADNVTLRTVTVSVPTSQSRK